MKRFHKPLLSLSDPAHTPDRVAEMLVVRQEVEVHSPARMWPIPVSTGTGIEGTLLCSMRLTRNCIRQCAHGCGDTVSMMMRFLLGKGHMHAPLRRCHHNVFPLFRGGHLYQIFIGLTIVMTLLLPGTT